MVKDKVKTLGRMIREERRRQKLTQEQLAAASGVGVRFVRELEQGKASCQIGRSLVVLTMLGLDVQVDGRDL